MSALDDLHGEGAREELERRLTPDGYEVEVRDGLYDDGRVDAVISWWRSPRSGTNAASATLQFWPERKEVRVSSWDMRSEAGLGITTLMNAQAVGLGREWGYEVLAATGVTDPVVAGIVSEHFGYAPDPDVPGRYVVDLTAEVTVLEEYGRSRIEGGT